MRYLNTREIQLYELDILYKFVEICRAYNLRYYLSGGTLLGAIRHKGFIPWDDDIDLAMPRDDFMKLAELSKNFNDDIYEFFFFSQDGDYLLPYGKLVNKKTFIDSQFSEEEVLKHLWVDIMPMDGLPEDTKLVKEIYTKAERYRKIIKLCNAKLGEGKTVFKKYAKYILKPIAKLYGKKRAINNLNKLSMVYDYKSSKYIGAISWGLYGIGERMLKSEAENSVLVNFETGCFNSFGCWDSYLTGLYGNYMQLPPKEKQVTHSMKTWIEDE
ncbi:MAG: LicD family protein [Pasteurellaceae bacterium]|nr:LicD family protein [Pasteurellaceae bacterium]